MRVLLKLAAKRLASFFETLKNDEERAKSEGDKNIYFVDGREIFQGEEWDAVTVDGTHPNDFGFLRFAQCLEKVIAPWLGEANESDQV